MKNLEFVIAAYGIWCGAVALYLLYLLRRARHARGALRRLQNAPAGHPSRHA
ncbi:MAG: hypothetical protein HY342_12910 [Candidatus Lambdaproteobacteria bacterium]|nr:hypothetical protein [Candidatus Lambdaproteobacteria bacterium]